MENLEILSTRLREMRMEIRRDGFNFFSIIVIGFLLGLFTNVQASYLYDLLRKYKIPGWIISLITGSLLIIIYDKFKKTFMTPKEEEIEDIKKQLSLLLKNRHDKHVQ